MLPFPAHLHQRRTNKLAPQTKVYPLSRFVCVRHEEITGDYDTVIILFNIRNCFVINTSGNPLPVQSILVKITILNHRARLVQISSNLLRHPGTDGQ